jgi:pilus assembly protein CpaF
MYKEFEEYIANSFLETLIKEDSVTDISFNGKELFFLDNIKGRQKADISPTKVEALDFIRQIANISEKQFSFSEPLLDVSVGRYRINAVHSSITKVDDEKTVSFSLRIASLRNRILDDPSFMSSDEKEYLLKLLKNKESIVVAGATGSGKTELQKYLLQSLEKYVRVIVIDNIQELEGLMNKEDLDLTYWQVSTNMKDRTFISLIKNALRCNPDWLVISEARGEEMNDVLQSVVSGHPIITTLHAETIEEVPSRMARMIQLSNQTQNYEDLLHDIYKNFRNYVFVKRTIGSNGKVRRYISAIGKIKDNKMNLLFERRPQ